MKESAKGWFFENLKLEESMNSCYGQYKLDINGIYIFITLYYVGFISKFKMLL